MTIQVTKTFLPDPEVYIAYVRRIWANGWITNGGPLSVELEQALRNYLQTPYLMVCANGTLAIQLALRALGIRKEVITTPFSYVASVNALLWEHCTPVFVDIDPKTLCLDPRLVERAITSKTEAILAVHVYGLPCDVVALEQLAHRYRLKIIYDAAHAFGVAMEGRSLLTYGDLSTCSFHATKLFHTAEGGAVICHSEDMQHQLTVLRQFGHIGDTYYGLGINAKISELHAAMGLAVLPHLTQLIEARKEAYLFYTEQLASLPVEWPQVPDHVQYNYAYFPLILQNEQHLLAVKNALAENHIFARRYFYPPLNRLPHFTGAPCPIAEDLSQRVLALPLAHDLTFAQVEQIVSIIRKTLR